MHRGPAGAAALSTALQDAITPTRADLPERKKLVVLVGSTKAIGQAVRVPAPAGATRPWTTASRSAVPQNGAQPSDHCTSRRIRPTGQAQTQPPLSPTEFISGSARGTGTHRSIDVNQPHRPS
jgi:hypothetical protein